MTVASIDPAMTPEAEAPPRRRRLALVASKGTLDQAYPPMILATTAASLGWEVGIYFTFYGLDILHQDRFEKLKVASLANPAGPIKIPNLLGSSTRSDGCSNQSDERLDEEVADAKPPRFCRDGSGPGRDVLRMCHHDGGDGR